MVKAHGAPGINTPTQRPPTTTAATAITVATTTKPGKFHTLTHRCSEMNEIVVGAQADSAAAFNSNATLRASA